MRGFVILLIAGCGRIGFGPAGDPVGDGSATADVGPSEALIAHWQFEDVPGDGVLDSTGHGHTARCLTSCPTIDVAGKRGAGYRFDGVDDMLEVADAADFHIGGPLTLALWLDWTPDGGEVSLLTKRFGPSFRNSFQLSLRADGAMHICSTEALDLGRCDDTAAGVVPANTWTHLAYVFDGTSHVGYVDGVEVIRMPTTISYDEGLVYLGGDIDDSTPLFFVGGVLDDVRIYGRELAVAELAGLAAP